MLGWQKRYLDGRKPQLMELAAWGSGDAGIGVVGGKASHGLVAIDIDTDDTATAGAIVKVLPATPVSKIGQKGETRFFYGPDITTSQSWNIDGKRVCDLIGPGRQTVLPPTIHPDHRGAVSLARRLPGALRPRRPAADHARHHRQHRRRAGSVRLASGTGSRPHGGNGGNGAAQRNSTPTPTRRTGRLTISRWHIGAVGAGASAVQMPAGARRLRGSGDLAAVLDRASDKVRKLNLKIVPAGIRDFGAGGVATAAAIPRSIW